MTTTTAPPAVDVFVPGRPAPQGSKRHVGNGVMVESSKHVKPWRQDVREAMLHAMADQQLAAVGAFPLDGPLAVTLTFVLPRPKSHYRTGRKAHLLRDAAPPMPYGKPDLDKLERAVLDAISSAGTWHDDAQVSKLAAAKVYPTADGLPPGVLITIGVAA